MSAVAVIGVKLSGNGGNVDDAAAPGLDYFGDHVLAAEEGAFPVQVHKMVIRPKASIVAWVIWATDSGLVTSVLTNMACPPAC